MSFIYLYFYLLPVSSQFRFIVAFVYLVRIHASPFSSSQGFLWHLDGNLAWFRVFHETWLPFNRKSRVLCENSTLLLAYTMCCSNILDFSINCASVFYYNLEFYVNCSLSSITSRDFCELCPRFSACSTFFCESWLVLALSALHYVMV